MVSRKAHNLEAVVRFDPPQQCGSSISYDAKTEACIQVSPQTSIAELRSIVAVSEQSTLAAIQWTNVYIPNSSLPEVRQQNVKPKLRDGKKHKNLL